MSDLGPNPRTLNWPYMVVRSTGDVRYVRDRRTGRDIGPIHWREAHRLKAELNADPARPLEPGAPLHHGGRR